VAGGRTALLDQYVPYPFHITRPFYANPARPGLATLYLQSASGGVYAGDDLALALRAGAGAAAHVTTQSATIVHACRAAPARLSIAAEVGAGGFLAYLPDPLVLFPEADVATTLDVTMQDGARAILTDAAALHDPAGEGRLFRRFHGAVTIRDATGAVRLRDAGGVTGDILTGPAVLGPWRAWGLLLALGPAALLPQAAALEAAAEALGCFAGASLTPSGLGLSVRLLGPDGGTLGRCLAALAAEAAELLAGCRLIARGK
jgi:urease accessory protein